MEINRKSFLVFLIALVVLGATFGGLRWLSESGNAARVGLLVAVVIAIVLLILSAGYYWDDSGDPPDPNKHDLKDLVLTLMIILFGGAVGLVIGALVSPYDSDESGFSKLTTAILTLVTGYLAAKA